MSYLIYAKKYQIEWRHVNIFACGNKSLGIVVNV